MKLGGGGIPRLSPLLLASLMLHIAAIAAIIGISRRETPERYLARIITVEFLEQRIAREGRTERGTPGPVMAPGSRRVPSMNTLSPAQSRPVTQTGTKQPENDTGETIPTIPPVAPTEKGSPLKTVGVVGGTSKGIGSGGGAEIGPDAGTGRSSGFTGGSAGAGTPTASSGASLQRRAAYLAQLKGLIEAHKEYPLAARRSRQEGSCLRGFDIDRSGALRKIVALSSCGHEFLDAAATRAITSIGTFPPIPDEFREAEATFTVTIRFTVEAQ